MLVVALNMSQQSFVFACSCGSCLPGFPPFVVAGPIQVQHVAYPIHPVGVSVVFNELKNGSPVRRVREILRGLAQDIAFLAQHAVRCLQGLVRFPQRLVLGLDLRQTFFGAQCGFWGRRVAGRLLDRDAALDSVLAHPGLQAA